MSPKVAGVTLQSRETVLHDLRPKWSAWLWPILLTFGFYAAVAWLKRRRTRYIITDQRAILKQGSWSGGQTEEFRLSDVTRLHTSKSLRENLLGGGTLVLDVGVDELRLPAVPNHSRVAASIREVQTK